MAPPNNPFFNVFLVFFITVGAYDYSLITKEIDIQLATE